MAKVKSIVRQRSIIEPSTGEIIDKFTEEKEIYPFKHFQKVRIIDLLDAMSKYDMTSSDIQILTFLMSNMIWSRNIVIASQTDIANELCLHISTVKRCIKKLINADIIIIQKYGIIKFNPKLIMMGDAELEKKLINDIDDLDKTGLKTAKLFKNKIKNTYNKVMERKNKREKKRNGETDSNIIETVSENV